MIEEQNITIEDLKEYKLDRPLIDKIRQLKYTLSNKKKRNPC